MRFDCPANVLAAPLFKRALQRHFLLIVKQEPVLVLRDFAFADNLGLLLLLQLEVHLGERRVRYLPFLERYLRNAGSFACGFDGWRFGECGDELVLRCEFLGGGFVDCHATLLPFACLYPEVLSWVLMSAVRVAWLADLFAVQIPFTAFMGLWRSPPGTENLPEHVSQPSDLR